MSAIPFILFILVWVLLYKYLVNKKQKGKLISHLMSFIVAILVMLLSIIPLTSKSNNQEVKIDQLNATVLSVSNYSYTFGDKQAVSLSLGKDKDNYININVHRENIKKGFTLNTKINIDDKNFISGTALWNKKQYFENKDSYIYLEIANLDYENKIAQLNIEANLYEAKENPSSLKIQLSAKITNELFDNLTNSKLISNK